MFTEFRKVLFAVDNSDFESVRQNSYSFVLIDVPNRITFGDVRTRDENTRVFGFLSHVRCSMTCSVFDDVLDVRSRDLSVRFRSCSIILEKILFVFVHPWFRRTIFTWTVSNLEGSKLRCHKIEISH